jgi:hypothetical protein
LEVLQQITVRQRLLLVIYIIKTKPTELEVLVWLASVRTVAEAVSSSHFHAAVRVEEVQSQAELRM